MSFEKQIMYKANYVSIFSVKLQTGVIMFIIVHPLGPDFDCMSCFEYFESWRKFPDGKVLIPINYSHYASRRK